MWVKYTKKYSKKYLGLEMEKYIMELLILFDKDEHRQARAINKHWTSTENIGVPNNTRNVEESAEDTVIRTMEHDAIREAIQQLSVIQQRRVILYFFCDFTQKEIAEFEGVSQQTVQRSICSALQNIGSSLNREDFGV